MAHLYCSSSCWHGQAAWRPAWTAEPAWEAGCLLKQLTCVESAAKPYPVSELLSWELAGVSSRSCCASPVGESPGKVWNKKEIQKCPKKAAGYQGFKVMGETQGVWVPLPEVSKKLWGPTSHFLKSLAAQLPLPVPQTALCMCWALQKYFISD